MRISDWSSDVCSSDLLDRLQIRGGREGFERRDRNPVLALLAKPHLGIARHLPVQSTERLGHLCTKSCDKRSGILAAAELAVIVGAACFEIPWQIVVGIPVAVRAPPDRKSVVEGKRVAVRVDPG